MTLGRAGEGMPPCPSLTWVRLYFFQGELLSAATRLFLAHILVQLWSKSYLPVLVEKYEMLITEDDHKQQNVLLYILHFQYNKIHFCPFLTISSLE